MVGVLCDQWDLWLTWDDQTRVPLLSNPTVNSRQLRLIAMSWIVNHCVKKHTTLILPTVVTVMLRKKW